MPLKFSIKKNKKKEKITKVEVEESRSYNMAERNLSIKEQHICDNLLSILKQKKISFQIIKQLVDQSFDFVKMFITNPIDIKSIVSFVLQKVINEEIKSPVEREIIIHFMFEIIEMSSHIDSLLSHIK